MTPAQLQQKATQTAVKFKAECIRLGHHREAEIADHMIRAVKALPAYELAVAAVADIGETGLPAAVIRRLSEGKK